MCEQTGHERTQTPPKGTTSERTRGQEPRRYARKTSARLGRWFTSKTARGRECSDPRSTRKRARMRTMWQRDPRGGARRRAGASARSNDLQTMRSHAGNMAPHRRALDQLKAITRSRRDSTLRSEFGNCLREEWSRRHQDKACAERIAPASWVPHRLSWRVALGSVPSPFKRSIHRARHDLRVYDAAP